MKHVKLFESWHKVEVCPECNGTGHVGPSKGQSIKNILTKGTEKEFLDYIDDGDFVENAADLFKKMGVHTLRNAKLVAALGLTREELQGIIKTTVDHMDDIEYTIDANKMSEKPFSLLPQENIEKLKNVLKDKAEILAILRGR